MKNLEELIKFDAVAEAEKAVGIPAEHSGDVAKLALDLLTENDDAKREILNKTQDCHYGTTVEDYMALVTELGFETVLHEEFDSAPHSETQTVKEQFYIQVQKDLGMILRWDSYRGSVNSARVYFMIADIEFTDANHVARRNMSRSYSEEANAHSCDYDGREALRYQIRNAIEMLPLLKSWPKGHDAFLWFLHHRDEDRLRKHNANNSNKLNYEEFIAMRTAQFPQWVRDQFSL